MSNWLRSIGFEVWYWLGYKLDVKPELMGAVPIYPPTIYQDTPETQATLARLVAENDELKAGIEHALAENEKLLVRNGGLWEELNDVKGQLSRAKAEVAELKNYTPPNPTGDGRPNAKKLTKREVALIHEYHRAGWTNADIARSLDVNKSTITRTINGMYHKGKK